MLLVIFFVTSTGLAPIQDGWYPIPSDDREHCLVLKERVESYLETIEQEALVQCM